MRRLVTFACQVVFAMFLIVFFAVVTPAIVLAFQ
jgi:hypothetical protein